MASPVFLNRPLTIASLPYSQRLQFPSARVVYLVFADERLLYVGATMNLRQRLMSHHRTTDFIREGYTRVVWVSIPRHWRLKRIEQWAIDSFQPLLNYKPEPKPDLATTKITPEAKYWLKYIGSVEGERLYETIERLVLAEAKRLELDDGRLVVKNGSKSKERK